MPSFLIKEKKEISLKHNLVRLKRIWQAIKLHAHHIFSKPSGEWRSWKVSINSLSSSKIRSHIFMRYWMLCDMCALHGVLSFLSLISSPFKTFSLLYNFVAWFFISWENKASFLKIHARLENNLYWSVRRYIFSLSKLVLHAKLTLI